MTTVRRRNWERAYRARRYRIPSVRKRILGYSKTPRARRKLRLYARTYRRGPSGPRVRKWRRERYQRPEVKKKVLRAAKKYYQRPRVKAHRRAYQRMRYATDPAYRARCLRSQKRSHERRFRKGRA